MSLRMKQRPLIRHPDRKRRACGRYSSPSLRTRDSKWSWSARITSTEKIQDCTPAGKVFGEIEDVCIKIRACWNNH